MAKYLGESGLNKLIELIKSDLNKRMKISDPAFTGTMTGAKVNLTNTDGNLNVGLSDAYTEINRFGIKFPTGGKINFGNTINDHLTISNRTGDLTIETGETVTNTDYNVHLHGIATPEAKGDAANKSYVDNTVNNKVASYMPLSGGTFTGNVTFGPDARLNGILTPQNDTDAVNKKYVDDAVATSGGLTWRNHHHYSDEPIYLFAPNGGYVKLSLSSNAWVSGLYDASLDRYCTPLTIDNTADNLILLSAEASGGKSYNIKFVIGQATTFANLWTGSSQPTITLQGSYTTVFAIS